MKNCIACNTDIEEDAHFCPDCGANQGVKIVYVEKHNKPVTLIVLCVLTICGSLFTVLRALIYEFFAAIADDEGIAMRGIIYILTSAGTITGAILMLGKRLAGLYVYTISQVIYIVTIFVAAFSYTDKFSLTPSGSRDLSTIIIFYFGIPSIIFLVVYWLSDIRKDLK